MGEAIDVLVNNAGVNPRPRSLTETAPHDWDDVIEGNLRGVYLVSHAIIPRMVPGGSVVNLSSILGLTGVKGCSAYTAAKGAIIALTRSMARDYAPNLRVNCICPGAVETEMFETYLARAA
ncbi:MAG: SDR family oxidoreductase, partial [Gammaproteobacteria bacterium]|nr:SDR family oxidoreductase [Gammaproteobacteria bacterium]NIR81716.1 SDR family oxidoreductase [Gammaproteobacteria bacterium]NIU02822.1 SDR family oxidoreductase [Gammaproteobacteria bacterium]NIV50345.1 SDR family oxidoreductase [Gammaproteobacteria bacterium]NIX84097.1 SDR family oxidoreductase [Gammaproteobacteria bacterium]